MTKKISKKEGFTLKITSEIAEALGVTRQSDLRIIVKDDEVILKAKKKTITDSKKREEENRKLTRRLIKQYSSVLERLAKT